VHNPIGARPGDVVEIYMHHRALWQGAVILYGFPLMGLIFGAVAGARFGSHWFGNESTAAVLAGLAGLAAGLAIAVAVGNSRYAKRYLVPTITKIIDRNLDPGNLNFNA
jgi:positive regulator of sigma E activity